MANQLNGGFACFRASGTQYHGTPQSEFGGTVEPFPQVATTRLLGGYDRLVKQNLLLGVRLGWVLRGGGPRPDGAQGPEFLPFHGEFRIGYALGRDPFQHNGFRPSFFVSAGVAQVDTLYRLTILEDTTKPPAAIQLDNPQAQELAVYRKSGTGFVGAGVTLSYAISQRLGLSLGTKLQYFFPTPGFVISLEAGVGTTF